jgi:hypothetical protein
MMFWIDIITHIRINTKHFAIVLDYEVYAQIAIQ